jgi:acyl dehydratase
LKRAGARATIRSEVAMTEAFDPATHKFCDHKWFEDFAVGERFYVNSRTQTDGIFAQFQAASGDNHPIHYDVEYCKARGHAGLLAHGFQVLIQSAAGGGVFPHVVGDALIGFLEVSAKFLKPVYAGDTLYPMLEIVETVPGRTTGVLVLRATIHNQRRDLVLEGTHRYLVRKRPKS